MTATVRSILQISGYTATSIPRTLVPWIKGSSTGINYRAYPTWQKLRLQRCYNYKSLGYSGAMRRFQFLNPLHETLLGVLAGATLWCVGAATLWENGVELFQDFHNLPEVGPLVRLQGAALLNQGSEGRWTFWRNCWPQVLEKINHVRDIFPWTVTVRRNSLKL